MYETGALRTLYPRVYSGVHAIAVIRSIYAIDEVCFATKPAGDCVGRNDCGYNRSRMNALTFLRAAVGWAVPAVCNPKHVAKDVAKGWRIFEVPKRVPLHSCVTWL